LSCPYRYKKEYIQKKLSMKSMSENHYYFGLSIHQALSRCLSPGTIFNIKKFKECLKETWQDGKYEDRRVSKEDFSTAFKMIKSLSENEYFRRVPKIVESRFRVPINGAVLTGSIDRVDLSGNTLEVIDYKSGDKHKPREDLKENFQWYFYYYGCKKILGRYPSKMTFIYFDTGRIVSFPIKKTDAEKATERFERAIRALLSEKEFKPKENIWCINCRFDRECGNFK